MLLTNGSLDSFRFNTFVSSVSISFNSSSLTSLGVATAVENLGFIANITLNLLNKIGNLFWTASDTNL